MNITVIFMKLLISRISVNGDKTSPIRQEYNYFRYWPSISKRTDIFSQPEGYYCERQTDKRPLPELPVDFSLVSETLFLHNKHGKTYQMSYAYSSQIIMWEFFDQTKIVHDYFSGK